MTTTLLAVDDSKTMRRVLEITFAGEDFRAVLSDGADDAMNKLQAERPQVALVDAGLDGTNGYDLCKRIKGAAPNVAVILLASKQQPYDRTRGSAAGVDDFVDKPFDTQQLIDKVVAASRKTAAAPAGAQSPMAPAVAPKTGEFGRPRVQTLAYGSTPHMPAISVAPKAVSPADASVRPAAVQVDAPTNRPPVAPVAAAQPATATPLAVTHAAPSAAQNGIPAEFAGKLRGLGLSQAQVEGVLALSREVVEKVVWEVVPVLAEALIKEEIQRLISE